MYWIRKQKSLSWLESELQRRIFLAFSSEKKSRIFILSSLFALFSCLKAYTFHCTVGHIPSKNYKKFHKLKFKLISNRKVLSYFLLTVQCASLVLLKSIKISLFVPYLFRKRRLIYDTLFQVNIPRIPSDLCIYRKWAKPQNWTTLHRLSSCKQKENALEDNQSGTRSM